MQSNIVSYPKKQIKCVMFDMDNTLFDFVAAKLVACREILSYIAGEEENSSEDPSVLFGYFLRGNHGFENCNNIRDYMQERRLFTVPRYTQCCEIYEREKLQNLELYPGVKETLIKLKKQGLKLAVITDADSNHAFSRLSRVELLIILILLLLRIRQVRKNRIQHIFSLPFKHLVPDQKKVLLWETASDEILSQPENLD